MRISETNLEARLAFFCMDEPEWILKISEAHPHFRKRYAEIYEMCRNPEEGKQLYYPRHNWLDSQIAQIYD